MLALYLIITECSICLRDISDIHEPQATDSFQTQNKSSNLEHYISVYIKLSTLSCRVSYVLSLAKAVNVLAIRQVKQGTETARFRISRHGYWL